VIRAVYAPLLVALSFLTLLPVGVSNPTNAEISRSRGWYPFVGLLYGALLLGMALLWALPLALPIFLQALAALLVVALAVANRFLHLDGLMDFCDAMWGGHTVERRLEIMRDSRVGSFAVVGCVSVLLVKFSALLSLLTIVSGLSALLFFPMVSRWTMTLLLTVFPYGRQQGIGSAFASSGRPWLATAFALLTVVAGAWFLLGPVGIIVLILASLVSLLLGWWASRRLGGGLTGDCYGAANEIMEALALVLLLVLLWRAEMSGVGIASGYGIGVVVGYGGGILTEIPWPIGLPGDWFSYPAP
jgi:adenosylcobinamide-GDP ribazoletransferase